MLPSRNEVVSSLDNLAVSVRMITGFGKILTTFSADLFLAGTSFDVVIVFLVDKQQCVSQLPFKHKIVQAKSHSNRGGITISTRCYQGAQL